MGSIEWIMRSTLDNQFRFDQMSFFFVNDFGFIKSKAQKVILQTDPITFQPKQNP